MPKPPALGKGLGALIAASKPAVASPAATPVPALASPVPVEEKGERVMPVPVGDILPCPWQPRKVFAPEAIAELVESIRAHGILQPLIVRRTEGGAGSGTSVKFELIAGERRLRASREAGLATVPVIVREATNEQVLELALVENIQRSNLNPMEEAEAYARLSQEFSLTHEQIAERVGKGRVAVSNALRLLQLPAVIQGYIVYGQLSVGHAKAILALTTEQERTAVAEKVVRDNLTVRQTEKVVAELQQGAAQAGAGAEAQNGSKKAARPADPIFTSMESRLRQHLGTRVRFVGGARKGKIEIEYFSPDDLNRVLGVLGVTDF
ncbi:transcriptional regulator [Verrucomicrobia bacterium LW23]|nr:transcriptional regulator [Verrucomicrobia bacterium LW23]